MGLTRTVSDRNGDFSRKLRFSPPRVFNAPVELGIGARGQKKLRRWGTGPRKKFDDIFSRLDTIHERDRRTDRRTAADSKDRAYL